jgi:hypothetical protein
LPCATSRCGQIRAKTLDTAVCPNRAERMSSSTIQATLFVLDEGTLGRQDSRLRLTATYATDFLTDRQPVLWRKPFFIIFDK